MKLKRHIRTKAKELGIFYRGGELWLPSNKYTKYSHTIVAHVPISRRGNWVVIDLSNRLRGRKATHELVALAYGLFLCGTQWQTYNEWHYEEQTQHGGKITAEIVLLGLNGLQAKIAIKPSGGAKPYVDALSKNGLWYIEKNGLIEARMPQLNIPPRAKDENINDWSLRCETMLDQIDKIEKLIEALKDVRNDK